MSVFLASQDLPLSPLNLAAGGVMIALAMAVAASAAISLRRRDRARLGSTTRRMFRALGVRRGDRRLIDLLARRMGAPGAALLFSRGCFDRAAAFAPGTERLRLAALRGRLFG